MRTPSINLSGKTFGELTVIAEADSVKARDRMVRRWKCRCTCGEVVDVRHNNLQYGISTSCGQHNKLRAWLDIKPCPIPVSIIFPRPAPSEPAEWLSVGTTEAPKAVAFRAKRVRGVGSVSHFATPTRPAKPDAFAKANDGRAYPVKPRKEKPEHWKRGYAREYATLFHAKLPSRFFSGLQRCDA